MSITDQTQNTNPFPIHPKFKHIDHNLSKRMMIENPFPQNFDIYLKMCGIELKSWQRQECINMMQKSEYLINWGRGMSKTLLFTLVSVFDALCGLKTVYLVPRTDELSQPMEYFNANPFIDFNPYKRGSDRSFNISKSTWFNILGKPMIKISNIDDKGFNVSSGRFSRIKLDESALLMYYKMENELYNKTNGMLRSMPYPRKTYASTPLIGSYFVTMKEDFEKHFPDKYSWRNFENTPNNFLTDTPEKLRIIEEEREHARRTGILHAWETENLAIPRTASGAAFKNIFVNDIAIFPSQTPTHIGFDFHGYKIGHIWVGFYYNSYSSPQDVWILSEGAEKYSEENTADESMKFLENNSFFQGKILKGESGGMINDPYVKAGRKYGMVGINIQGGKKHVLESNILNYRIHIPIDPKSREILTPNFYRDIKDAEWRDPNKFELRKESSGNKFRNHYIDAFMNALPLSQGKGIYIPNKKLRAKSFIELDKQAHKIALY